MVYSSHSLHPITKRLPKYVFLMGVHQYQPPSCIDVQIH